MKIYDRYNQTLQSIDENGNIKTTFDIEEHTGFIIIQNAILASAGVLEYAGYRLGLTGDDANKFFKIFQSEEDLFNETNLKGANGVILTDEHPQDRVVEIFEKGDFIQFGFTLERAKQIGKYLVNDIKITSPSAIARIISGESLGFSLGYEVEYIKQMGIYDDGGVEIKYDYIKSMKLINHIALTTSPRNKETIFTDKDDKKKGEKKMKKVVFYLGNDSTETITTDSVDELLPLIVKQNQIINDGSDRIAEIKEEIQKLKDELETEKTEAQEEIEKLKTALEEEQEKKQEQENDSLLKDIKDFATTQQIKISNDSDDVEVVLKEVISNDGIDVKDLDLKSLKPMYQLLKKQNSATTLGSYKTGKANDAVDEDIEAQTRAYFNGGVK